MDNFLKNIVRYPRFFISSVLGLIFVILSPFKNLVKTTKSRIFLILFLILFFTILQSILKNMLSL